MAAGNWSREETILALALYCTIPFGRINKTNPQVIELASIIGRTPSSVGMKMCNLGRFDPELRKRNVYGLSNGSKMDETVWVAFAADNESLVEEAARIRAKYTSGSIEQQVDLFDLPDLPEGLEKERIIKLRLNQRFFRETLLSSYRSRCCITGLAIPDLLIASHIKPWRVSDPKTERTAPTNGLLLSALHGKAFEKGLISITPSYEIIVSSKLSSAFPANQWRDWIMPFAGKQITLPEKFVPEKRFIEYHNDVVFQS